MSVAEADEREVGCVLSSAALRSPGLSRRLCISVSCGSLGVAVTVSMVRGTGFSL